MDATTVEKTAMLTANVGITYSGMGPDFRVLVNKGRKAGQKYWLEYHDPIPVALLARELATVMQVTTRTRSRRGCGLQLAPSKGSELTADFAIAAVLFRRSSPACCRSSRRAEVCDRLVCRCWWPALMTMDRSCTRSMQAMGFCVWRREGSAH